MQKKTKNYTQRKVKLVPHKSFKLTKKQPKPTTKLSSAWKLLRGSISFLSKNKKLFGGILLVNLVLSLVLVRGFIVDSEVVSLKETFSELFDAGDASLFVALGLFVGMVSTETAAASSEVASLYQSIIFVISSLAIIWAIREVYADKKPTVKSAFYSGMYPLVPFLLVSLVMGLQLIPLVVANWLYVVVIQSGLAVTALEQFIWGMLIILLLTFSLYMVTSSVFALYISTLPNMTPLNALRSAKRLVYNRRFTILRKLILLPIYLMIIGALIMVPVILLATAVAGWAYFILSMLALLIVHSYIYRLYRELL